MRFVSYGEQERIDYHRRGAGVEPVSSFSVDENETPQMNEDAMDAVVLEGMVQVLNNFPFLWGVLATGMGMSIMELKDMARSYAAKKAKANIKR